MKPITAVFLACILLAGCGAVSSPAQSAAVLPAQGQESQQEPAPQQKAAPEEKALGTALHFSVDDAIGVFADLTANQEAYTSIFDNDMLAFLQKMHQQYGLRTSLYCFYESVDGSFDLSQCTTRFAHEFAENAHWLRVGFHAFNDASRYSQQEPETAAGDYASTVQALAEICGAQSIDPVIRLHYWDAADGQLAAMKEKGLRGLLAGRSPDDPHYALGQGEVDRLFAEDFLLREGLLYTPTDLWLEQEEDLSACLRQLQEETLVVAFTHEWAMGDEEIRTKIEECAQYVAQSGYGFAFPLDYYTERGMV